MPPRAFNLSLINRHKNQHMSKIISRDIKLDKLFFV